ncbi:MAG: hypothetical protein R3C68_07515 [Myxococcota bacterium]
MPIAAYRHSRHLSDRIANPIPAGQVAIGISGETSKASSFLVDNDENRFHALQFMILWSPIDALEIYANYHANSNTNNAFAPRTTQVLGDRTLD